MKPQIADSILRLVLAWTMIFAPLTQAAEAPPPQTQTGGGSGGITPPNLPPVNYGGGSGGEAEGPRTNARPAGPRFLDLYLVDVARNPIFHDGLKHEVHGNDGPKRSGVFQFIEQTGNQHIRRGYLLPSSAGHGETRIEWLPGNYSFIELLAERAKMFSEHAREQLTQERLEHQRRLSERNRILRANQANERLRRTLQPVPAEPAPLRTDGVVNTTARSLHVFQISTLGDVYFEGNQDLRGRERVFRFNTTNPALIDRGYIKNMQTAELVWDKPGQPRAEVLSEIANRSYHSDVNQRIKDARAGYDSLNRTLRNGPQMETPTPRETQPRENARGNVRYPAYPTLPTPAEPIPSSRALTVPEGSTVQTHSPRGGGASEINSPQTERILPRQQPASLWSEPTRWLRERFASTETATGGGGGRNTPPPQPPATPPAEPSGPKRELRLDTSPGHVPRALEAVPFVTSPEGNKVLYTDARDEAGRRRVFSSVTENGQIRFRNGVINPMNGEIIWERALNARPIGVTNYPSYPELQGPRQEIPRERALTVPQGSVVRDVPRGSGQAEISSPQREYLPEFNSDNPRRGLITSPTAQIEMANQQGSELWQQGRPSRLNETLEWTRGKGVRLRAGVHDYLMNGGLRATGARAAQTAREAGAATGRAGADFARVSASFYMAVGLFAAYELAFSYSNDPRAWTAWLESGTDPVFYLSLGTFMLAAAPFYRGMGSLTQGRVSSVLPRFAGALVVGGVASHFVAGLLNDPNFNKCLGFTSYKQTGKFERDLEACDKLYDKYANYQLDNEMMPLVANLLASTGVFFVSMRAMAYLARQSRVASALSATVRVLKIPPAMIQSGGVRAVAAMAFFLAVYELTGYLGIGDSISRRFLTDNPDYQYPVRAAYDWLFKGEVRSYINEHGNSLNDSEVKLLTEWKRLKANKWKNPYLWERVCLDSKRNFQLLYNCDQPDQLDIHSVIKRHGELQTGWREFLMGPTTAAFNSWSKKVHNYNGVLSAAYVFYKDVFERRQKALQEGKPTINKEEEDRKRELINALGTQYGSYYHQSWPKVLPRDFYDFMVTSMACGPEAESFGRPGYIGSIYQYFFGKSPSEMASDSMWSDIQFFPPRIVEAQQGGDIICNNPDFGGILPKWMRWTPGLFRVDEFPYVKADNSPSRGLLNYVHENIRTSIVDDRGQVNFDTWWTENVLVPHETLQAKFRAEYEKMLKRTYISALENKTYHQCDQSRADLRIPSLQRHLRDLGRVSDCQAEATHRLANGILNSLNDELRLYSALMLDMYESLGNGAGQPFPNRARLRNALIDIDELFGKMKEHISTIEPGRRTDLEPLREKFAEISKTLRDLSEELMRVQEAAWVAANPGQSRAKWLSESSHIPLLATTLQSQMEGVFFQALEYRKVLTSFEESAVTPAPAAATQ